MALTLVKRTAKPKVSTPQYKIVYAVKLNAMSGAVEAYLVDGWTLVGGIFVDTDSNIFYQAMTHK